MLVLYQPKFSGSFILLPEIHPSTQLAVGFCKGNKFRTQKHKEALNFTVVCFPLPWWARC